MNQCTYIASTCSNFLKYLLNLYVNTYSHHRQRCQKTNNQKIIHIFLCNIEFHINEIHEGLLINGKIYTKIILFYTQHPHLTGNPNIFFKQSLFDFIIKYSYVCFLILQNDMYHIIQVVFLVYRVFGI